MGVHSKEAQLFYKETRLMEFKHSRACCEQYGKSVSIM